MGMLKCDEETCGPEGSPNPGSKGGRAASPLPPLPSDTSFLSPQFTVWTLQEVCMASLVRLVTG